MQCAFLLWPKNPARKRTLTPALYRARRERGAAAAAQKIRERERERGGGGGGGRRVFWGVPCTER